MGLETATHISELVPSNPVGASDKKSQGDDHLRLIKAVLQEDFPNADKAFYFPNAIAKSANYTVLAADDNKLITGDASGGAITFTLPTLTADQDGWAIRVGKVDDSTNAIVLAGTINGDVNYSLTRQWDWAILEWTGVEWLLRAADRPTPYRVVTKTADATLTAEEMRSIVLVTPGSTVVTITLPTASAGEWVVIKNLHATRFVTVDPPGAVTIDGVASIMLTSQYDAVFLVSDGTNWFIEAQTQIRQVIQPGGYLTLVSATPVITTDQAAKTSIFYAIDKGNQVPIPNGVKFTIREFTELTLALSATQHAADTNYDVFIAVDPADNATLIIGTGPAWSVSTAGSGARGSGAGTTELARLKGLLVNNVAITMRNGATTYAIPAASALYVGTIRTDPTIGQISCHVTVGQSRRWGVWNAYNRKTLQLVVADPTASWNYSSTTVRQSRATAGNSLTTLCGLADELVFLDFTQRIGPTSDTGSDINCGIGIGVNSTTTMSGMKGLQDFQTTGSANTYIRTNPVARHTLVPQIGINNINSLEFGDPTGNMTFDGTESAMRLTARWMG